MSGAHRPVHRKFAICPVVFAIWEPGFEPGLAISETAVTTATPFPIKRESWQLLLLPTMSATIPSEIQVRMGRVELPLPSSKPGVRPLHFTRIIVEVPTTVVTLLSGSYGDGILDCFTREINGEDRLRHEFRKKISELNFSAATYLSSEHAPTDVFAGLLKL